MSIQSLREYIQKAGNSPNQGVRSCCAPGISEISMRTLMSSIRIIHISDLHFTSSSFTFDWGKWSDSIGAELPKLDHQDSKRKSREIASFLIDRLFDATSGPDRNIVFITGDLTDSGNDSDYQIAKEFIQRLKVAGFTVYATPGNHDYCIEGNFFVADVLSTIYENVSEILSATPKPPPGFPDPLKSFVQTNTFKLLVKGVLLSFGINTDLGPLVSMLFLRYLDSENFASNQERRQKFIQAISGNNSKYPQWVDFDNGRLILLDSLQAQLDEHTKDRYAEGKLGVPQLSKLATLLEEYQEERKAGKKIVVGLHHSPFKPVANPSLLIGLRDCQALLSTLRGKIDCLLFGHTTPPDQDQQPSTTTELAQFAEAEREYQIPLINCENLEHTSMSSSYSITVLDLGSYQRTVFQTDTVKVPPPSWGIPSN